MIDLRKLQFNAEKVQEEANPSPRALRPLGKEILSLAKFWVLYLSIVGVSQLPNGVADLKKWSVEDSEENQAILGPFLPQTNDTVIEMQEENDQIFLMQWSQHQTEINDDDEEVILEDFDGL